MAEAFEEGPYVYGVMPGTVSWGAPEGWCGGLFDDLQPEPLCRCR